MSWTMIWSVALSVIAGVVFAICLMSDRGKRSVARAGLAMVRWGQQQLADAGTHPHVGATAALILDDLAREERRRQRLATIAMLATAHDHGAHVVIAERDRDGLKALYGSSDTEKKANDLAALANEHAQDIGSGFTYRVKPHPRPGKRWRPEMANSGDPNYVRSHR